MKVEVNNVIREIVAAYNKASGVLVLPSKGGSGSVEIDENGYVSLNATESVYFFAEREGYTAIYTGDSITLNF